MDTLTMQAAPPISLSAEQTAFYNREGYLVVRGITTLPDLERVREIYERLFASKIGLKDGNLFDLVSPSEDGEVKNLPQMTSMLGYAPELAETLLYRNVSLVAKQLLGPTARYVFDHGIRKPAHGPPTLPHQDRAYYGVGTRYESLTFWVPMHDVTVESGCMEFVPRSHRGPLWEHRTLNNDPRVHGLEIPDPRANIGSLACPINAGDCTIHHSMTVHSTGPNVTESPRLAFGLAFGRPTRRSVLRYNYPWNAGKNTERDRNAWKALSPYRKLKAVVRTGLIRAGLY